MKTKTLFAALLFFFGMTLVAMAASNLPPEAIRANIKSAFRLYQDVGPFEIQVPTVAEMTFSERKFDLHEFAVFDKTTTKFIPYAVRDLTTLYRTTVAVSTPSKGVDDIADLHDGSALTSTEFPFQDSHRVVATIVLTAETSITSNLFTLSLERFTALPRRISITARTPQGEKIVLAERALSGTRVHFPETTARRFVIRLTYYQPLYISELSLSQENATRSAVSTIRFLARPQHSYRVYFASDRFVDSYFGERGNLMGVPEKEVFHINTEEAFSNPRFRKSDEDGDGIADVTDNCLSVANPSQTDIDRNGRGDVCDDFDRDGIINSLDICPKHTNRYQKDTDSDGKGDACDGVESRVTEKYPWLPWMGIGFAGLVLIILFAFTTRDMSFGKKEEEADSNGEGGEGEADGDS